MLLLKSASLLHLAPQDTLRWTRPCLAAVHGLGWAAAVTAAASWFASRFHRMPGAPLLEGTAELVWRYCNRCFKVLTLEHTMGQRYGLNSGVTAVLNNPKLTLWCCVSVIISVEGSSPCVCSLHAACMRAGAAVQANRQYPSSCLADLHLLHVLQLIFLFRGLIRR